MVPYLLILVFLPQQTLNTIPYIDRVDFISNYDMKAMRKDRFYADASGFRRNAVSVYIDSDIITDKVLRAHLPLKESYVEEIALMAEQSREGGKHWPLDFWSVTDVHTGRKYRQHFHRQFL